MGVEFGLGGEEPDEVPFVGLGLLENVESFLAALEIPDVGFHRKHYGEY